MSTVLVVSDVPNEADETGDNALVVLDEIQRKLASITGVAEAKDLRDQAEALRRYAQQSRSGLAVQNHCARVKFLAEHRAGELLLAEPRGGQGGRPTETPSDDKGVSPAAMPGFWSPQRLAQLGVKPHEAHWWQALAKLPLDELHKVLEIQSQGDAEITKGAVSSALWHWQDRQQRGAQHTSAPAEDSEASETKTAGVAGGKSGRDPSREKRVTLFFNRVAYEEFAKRLRLVMAETGASNHTEAVVKVVEVWARLDNQVRARVQRVMEVEGLRSPGEAILRALEAWERQHEPLAVACPTASPDSALPMS